MRPLNYFSHPDKKQGALEGSNSIQFVLLNPEIHIQDVMKDCKAMLLAGGALPSCYSA